MKTLMLVRHAKSDKGNMLLKDIDRPLNDRGYADAYLISDYLRSEGKNIQLFITSPAMRALSTALIYMRTWGFSESEALLIPELYEAEPEDYPSILGELDNDADTIALFAHNPTISQVFSKLTKSADIDLPTCATCILTAEITDWKQMRSAEFRVMKQVFPKHLKPV